MLNPEHKKILAELRTTQYGVALKAFLDEELDELNDVSTLKSWDDTVGSQKAVKIIKKLFSFMGEKKTSAKVRNQYE